MGYINYRFLEAYKSLDKLCREIYRGDKGVTAYIDDMKATPERESRTVAGWHSDLRRLIALRHIRNQLTHECGTLDRDMCSESDIEWLNAFYDRILHQIDPLALRIIHDNREQHHAPGQDEDASGNDQRDREYKRNKRGLKAFFMFLWLLFACGLCAYFYFSLS